MNKLTQLLNSIPTKLVSLMKKKPANSVLPTQIPQPEVAPVDIPIPAPEPKVSFLGKINRKEIVILVIMFLVILTLALLAVVFKIKLPIPGFEQPTPAPIATPAPTPTPVPKYFNDPDILRLEENTNTLENELNNIDIEESNIQPRPLDWDINFKK